MEINTQSILNRFKVFSSPNLFDLDKDEFFALLKEKRCVWCGNKLKFMGNGQGAYCRGKKHKKSFFIRMSELNRINGT